MSQLAAGAIASLAGYDTATAISTADIAIKNNYLTSSQVYTLKTELSSCNTRTDKEACIATVDSKYMTLSKSNESALDSCGADLMCKFIHMERRKAGELAMVGISFPTGNMSIKYRTLQSIERVREADVPAGFRAVAGQLAFIDVNCGGVLNASCQQKWRAAQSSQLTGAALLVGGLFVPAVAVATTDAAITCFFTPTCVVNLGTAIDGIAADGAVYGTGGGLLALEAKNVVSTFSKTAPLINYGKYVAMGDESFVYELSTYAKLKGMANEVRATLPFSSDVNKVGNVGTAIIRITGKPIEEKLAYSRYNGVGQESVGGYATIPSDSTKWILTPTGSNVYRSSDTEFKILEDFSQKNKSNLNVKGSIDLFTERAPCGSCANVIREQFSKSFPNVDVRVFHANGYISVYKAGHLAYESQVAYVKNIGKFATIPSVMP